MQKRYEILWTPLVEARKLGLYVKEERIVHTLSRIYDYPPICTCINLEHICFIDRQILNVPRCSLDDEVEQLTNKVSSSRLITLRVVLQVVSETSGSHFITFA